METTTTTPYEAALDRLVGTDHTWMGGFSNHGPMAAEACVNLGIEDEIEGFLDVYIPLLEPGPTAEPLADPHAELVKRLPALMPHTGSLAGHGVLRTAHAVRALARYGRGSVPDIVSAEVGAALGYWEFGASDIPLTVVARLTGDRALADVASEAVLLPAGNDRGGLLTRTLEVAAQTDGFAGSQAQVAPGATVIDTLHAAALASVEAYLAHDGLAAFTFLHGVTVPTMAAEMLGALEGALSEESERALEAAGVGFVLAAVMGFGAVELRAQPANPAPMTPAALAQAAGRSRDDHSLKFVDACITLAERTGSDRPLVAATVAVADFAEVRPTGR